MLLVKAPNNFLPERRYIIDVFFKEFLGVTYSINFEDGRGEYEIQHASKSFMVKDCFWNNIKGEKYLRVENIPTACSVEYVDLIKDDLISIYGESKIIDNENKKVLESDVFASAFFMLSRWEEFVVDEKDEHDRFPTKASLAYKMNFYQKPIINHYIELLKKLLIGIGVSEFKNRKFDLVHTHDVDTPFMWRNIRNLFGRLWFYIKYNKNVTWWFTYDVFSYLKSVFGISKDPYDTYDYLMDQSEKCGTKSHFFFMDYGSTFYDRYYKINDRRIKKLIQHIQNRKHHIGFHPSYNLKNDLKKFKLEKGKLEKSIGASLKTGRHHFLRFNVPSTWRSWDQANMKWDSTLGYSDEIGFRCGTCYPFTVFDCEKRKHLTLVEKPLIVMEQALITNEKAKKEEMLLEIKQVIDQIKKYEGEFVLLWHNAVFNAPEFRQYEGVHAEIIHYCKEKM